MSASIFVNKNDRISVTVHYKINTDTGDVTVVDPDPKFTYKTITAKFRKPDFEAVQRIMHSSTVFDNGVPMVDILRVGKSILYHLIDGWDVKDDAGKDVVCDIAAVNALHPAIGNALSAGVQAKMGNLGQMFA